MLYIFDKTEKLVAILDNDGKACPYSNAVHTEKLNGENIFTFTVPADHQDSQYVVEGNLVAFKDLDGNWQLFEIKRVFDQHGNNLTRTAYKCEHVYYELIDDILTDVRPQNVSAAFALEQALQNSRWVVGTVDDLGTNSTNFYYESALSAVQKVANTWGGELRFRVVIEGGVISGRYVDLLARRGQETGKQFEYTKDIKEISREVDASNIITACYGRGKGEEVGTTEDGATYGRRITFANVEWKVANGDPVDKPLGQEWVGDDEALAQWGRNGRHRFGIFLDDEETDPAVLLQKTWDYLQANKMPKVSYSLSVLDLERLTGYEHEKVRLGDTVRIIDRAFTPELLVEARVIEIDRDLLQPENTEIVLGNFMPTLADSLTQQQKVITNVRDRQGVWDRATQFNPDGTLDTSWLNGIINTLQNELIGGGGTVKITDNDGILILDNATTPTKALMLKGGIFGIANSKDANGNWIWQTFGTGDGFTADLINAGQIQTSLVKIFGNTNFYWDSDNIYIINPANANQQIRLGKYDGTNLGIAFTIDGGTTWTQAITFTGINASAVTTGTMVADRIKGGTLTLGGSNNTNGVLSVRDATNVERVRGDVSGITVYDANFYIQDKKNRKSIIIPTTNMLRDHSFEMIPRKLGTVDSLQTFEVDVDSLTNLYNWRVVGTYKASARVLSTYNTDAPQMALFDYQAAVIRYWRTYAWKQYVQLDNSVGLDGPYTLSAYFAAYDGTTADTYAYIELWAVDANLSRISMVAGDAILILSTIPEKFKWYRAVATTTAALPSGTEYLEVVIFSNPDVPILCDGVQLVPLGYPTIYNPESALWRSLRRLSGYQDLEFPVIQSDTATINDRTWTAINFIKPFSATPSVVCTYAQNFTGDIGPIKVRNITTTGFEAVIAGSWRGVTRTINWIAVPRGVIY